VSEPPRTPRWARSQHSSNSSPCSSDWAPLLTRRHACQPRIPSPTPRERHRTFPRAPRVVRVASGTPLAGRSLRAGGTFASGVGSRWCVQTSGHNRRYHASRQISSSVVAGALVTAGPRSRHAVSSELARPSELGETCRRAHIQGCRVKRADALLNSCHPTPQEEGDVVELGFDWSPPSFPIRAPEHDDFPPQLADAEAATLGAGKHLLALRRAASGQRQHELRRCGQTFVHKGGLGLPRRRQPPRSGRIWRRGSFDDCERNRFFGNRIGGRTTGGRNHSDPPHNRKRYAPTLRPAAPYSPCGAQCRSGYHRSGRSARRD
jgi:hypothetical protein